MGEKMSHAVSYFLLFLFFFSNKMTKTAIGRQWMNNTRLLSRPSFDCAINMERGAFESLLAAWLEVARPGCPCRLIHAAQGLVPFRRHRKRTKSGVSFLGKNSRLSSAGFVACKAARRPSSLHSGLVLRGLFASEKLSRIWRLDFCTFVRCCCVFVLHPASPASDLSPASSAAANPVAVERQSAAIYLRVGRGDHPCSDAPHERGHLWLTAQVTGKLVISKSLYSVSWLVDQSRS